MRRHGNVKIHVSQQVLKQGSWTSTRDGSQGAEIYYRRRGREVKNSPQNVLNGVEQRCALFKSPLLCQAELRGQCFYFRTSVYAPGPCLFGVRGDPGLKCL